MRHSNLAAAIYVTSILSVNLMGPAHAASIAQVDAARVKGLVYLYKAQKGDGSWASSDSQKLHATAAALDALVHAGIGSGETFGSALAWLSNSEPGSVDGAARKIAALAKTGMDTRKLVQNLLSLRTQADKLTWGAYPRYDTSFPDTTLGIAAVRESGYSYANQADELIRAIACEILPAQRPNGGWSYARTRANEMAGSSNSALLPTALMLAELATAGSTHGWSTLTCPTGGSYNLATILNGGVTYLLSKKNPDNGFGEGGVSTPLQSALAYLAIQAVNAAHPSLSPAQDYLIGGAGNQLADGSWSGDPFTTALVIKTLYPLAPNGLADADRDGIPDEVELAMNTGNATNIADGRRLAIGNGQSQPGSTVGMVVATAYLNVPFSFSLQGGSPFRLASGQLPPGLILSTTGLISGTPISLGDFNFVYSNSVASTVAAITVVRQGKPGDINGDGFMDVADVAMLQRHIFGQVSLSPNQIILADLAPAGLPDGQLDVADLQSLVRRVLELE